jgi:hypothetical protein
VSIEKDLANYAFYLNLSKGCSGIITQSFLFCFVIFGVAMISDVNSHEALRSSKAMREC